MSPPSSPDANPYPRVDPKADFAAIERRVLASWKERGTFRRSVELRPAGPGGSNEYVFYDGPPFANGRPHFGHLLTGYVKDIVPRYQTMRGRRVERRFGWDCHGLPVEMEVERELGIAGRAKIQEYGIDRFNARCRAQIGTTTKEWERYVDRQARWVDIHDDYKTMDLSYMESVLWAFKSLWEKGLLYESYRVMPYSWAAETPVSNFETRLDDSYRERQDPALTVRFRLKATAEEPAVDVLVWTTTPWTLPSNLALAVGPGLEYALYERDGERLLIGAAAAAKYERELEGAQRVGTVEGERLVGRAYEPLFPFFADRPDAFRVLAGDFVDVEEGTGVVHLAPGFGEDDQRVCAENDIEIVCPVDEKGRFTAEVPDWQGVNVLEANKPIIAELKRRGAVVRHDTIVHSYPHCWRTDEPLIYKAVSSWYVQVTRIRDRMVELNRRIRWVPEHVRDGQFGKWLEGARDWSISRNRFWGSPIPVWKSDDPRYPRVDVYGSLAELERDFGVRLDDLHRPAVDDLTRPNPDDPTGKSTMRRVEEVLDCWFESGSMPFAQVHYPFENKEWFESHFPSDFVAEYVSQTRGWFYTLVVLATALFDRPPFENAICHGVVVDEDGQKLSKRKRNYPDPERVFETLGSDALRWFLCSSTVLRGGELRIDREGKDIAEVVRLVLNPIWNAWSFFSLYANADGVRGRLLEGPDAAGANVLDRYVLAKTRRLVESVQGALDAYDVTGACAEVKGFLDALNNWYIRRSRPRFWKAEHDADKRAAYDTLYTVLHALCRTAAPLLPLVTEEIYRGLTGEESVHLADWPDAARLPEDPALVEDMDFVRSACSAGLALREERRLRTRLPLARASVAGAAAARVGPFTDLIQDELNVKAVEVVPDLAAFGSFDLKPNARALGPRVGSRMKEILAAARAGDWERTAAGVRVAGVDLAPAEYELRLVPATDAGELAIQALPGGDAAIALDVAVTPELEREGLARDVVRLIQIARKEAGLHVSDRIRLVVDGAPAIGAALEAHEGYVLEQTLADSLELAAPPADLAVHRAPLAGGEVAVGVARSG